MVVLYAMIKTFNEITMLYHASAVPGDLPSKLIPPEKPYMELVM